MTRRMYREKKHVMFGRRDRDPPPALPGQRPDAHVVGRLSQGWIYFRDTLAAAFAAAVPLRHSYIEKARRTISVKRTHDGP